MFTDTVQLMCAYSIFFTKVLYNIMSASFTVCMHSYSCFLLQHFLSFLTAAAHLQTCPSVFISASFECWKTYFIPLPWEPAPSLTFGSFSSSPSLPPLCVSALLATESVLYPRAFSVGSHNYWISIFLNMPTFGEFSFSLLWKPR